VVCWRSSARSSARAARLRSRRAALERVDARDARTRSALVAGQFGWPATLMLALGGEAVRMKTEQRRSTEPS